VWVCCKPWAADPYGKPVNNTHAMFKHPAASMLHAFGYFVQLVNIVVGKTGIATFLLIAVIVSHNAT
jgi:3-methyladenine DNA glycosylase Mpg